MSDETGTTQGQGTLRVRLREWRERRGLSLRVLADRAGVSHVTILRIEAGTVSPTVDMLVRLAKALGVEARDLLPPTRRTRMTTRRRG
jgi:transcriptional regulator with XRE-family HTH domain